MKKVYLDTNVVLDAFLADRPSQEFSKQVLALSRQADDFRLYVSILSIADIAYVLRKNLGKESAISAITKLQKDAYILSMSDMMLYEALRSNCPDFEDALQISCADWGNCDCIITDNVKHFRGYAPLPVFSPEEFLDGIRRRHQGT